MNTADLALWIFAAFMIAVVFPAGCDTQQSLERAVILERAHQSLGLQPRAAADRK